MKFGCTQSDLAQNLALVSRAIPSRAIGHPILFNVLLSADVGTQAVTLTAFDLSVGIRVTFPAQVEVGGSITLPARLLSDIVTKLPALTHVILESSENGTVNLVSASGRYQMRSMAADEYPAFPSVEGNEVLIPVAALVEGIKAVSASVSTDETKQVLTGIRIFSKGDHIEFASTDGHRLARFRVHEAGIDIQATIPAKALRDLTALLSGAKDPDAAVAVALDQKQVVFHWGEQCLTSRILDGQYPNYNQLIPQQWATTVTVNRKALVLAIDRVAVLADQKNNVLKLSVQDDGQILVEADAQDVGNARELVDAQVAGPGLQFAVNCNYLAGGLRIYKADEVQIRLNSPTSPLIISPLDGSDALYLLMPVQIRA